MLKRCIAAPRAFLLVILLTLLVSPANAKIIFVKAPPGSSDSNDGLTWGTAKATIQAGINSAAPHDQVWVAKGYYESTTVNLVKDVEVYGGFVGAETSLSQRPAFPRPVPDPNETIQSYSQGTVVAMPLAADSSTRLDGFTLISYLPSGTDPRGGCIACIGSSPTIANNTMMGTPFFGWNYGGGIYCSAASPTITGNRIFRNSATYGGGISCNNGSCPIITNNTIIGNFGANDHAGTTPWGPGYGGAIFCDNQSSPTIANNVIGGNSASYGGAIYCKNGSAPSIVNNTFTGNYANDSGGAIYCDGASPSISNNLIAFNSSGIFSVASTPILRNNCLYNPDGADYVGLAAGEGDISLDPKLQAWEYGKVHIQPGSPCINAGNDAAALPGWMDMDGAARIAGGRVDIGADESDGTIWDATPRIIYVKPNGNDNNDGSSWAQARQSLRYGGGMPGYWGALDICSVVGGEIWVAAGTHTSSALGRPYIHLYGGFNGTETLRGQRNPTANVTNLAPHDYGIWAPQMGAGWHVSQIDGFTIGGRIGSVFGAPLITNNSLTFRSGITSIYSAPTISNNTIANVVDTTGKGAGIYYEHSGGVISANTIDHNQALYGGGIYCYYSSPNISGNTITNNLAAYGAGILCEYSSPEISQNTISGNNGTGSCVGSGICLRYYSSPIISNNTISGNTKASTGGGIYCAAGTGCSPIISGNMILNNGAIHGGGIYAVAASATLTLLNNTICANTAGASGGLWLRNNSSNSNLVVANNIIAFNSSGILDNGTSYHPVLTNNCVFNPDGTNYTGVSAGTGDISADPLFVDKVNSDYHIKLLSPCVNRGTSAGLTLPETDIDGQARVQYAAVDIGADECSSTASGFYESKLAADNVLIDLTGAIVSASIYDCFYVESDIRDCGIRVEKDNHGLSQGMRADISGTLKKNSWGERYIDATSAVANGSGSVAPFAISGKLLGGGKTGFQDAICRYSPAPGGSPVWGPMKGLSNIGLLVKIYGKVTMGGYGYFYVDDGSHVEDRSGFVGIYVSSNVVSNHWPPIGSFVSVTGISSCEIVCYGIA